MNQRDRVRKFLEDAPAFTDQMDTWYCAACGRFLGLHAIQSGVVSVKCRNCKRWNTLDIPPE